MIDFYDAIKWFIYNPETGDIFWNKRPANCVTVGDVAGCINGERYLYIRLKGIGYPAHRLAWLLYYGEFPPDQVDHINQIKTDNRIENLRCVTHSENQRNLPRRKNNTSGANGVDWQKTSNRWRATMRVSGKYFNLGQFENWFDAVCARKAAEYKHGFHPNHGRKL